MPSFPTDDELNKWYHDTFANEYFIPGYRGDYINDPQVILRLVADMKMEVKPTSMPNSDKLDGWIATIWDPLDKKRTEAFMVDKSDTPNRAIMMLAKYYTEKKKQ